MQYLKIFFLCVLSSLALPTFATNLESAVNYKIYTPYEATCVHVVTVDPNKVKITAARAQDIGYGLATVQDFARHYGALVAINGGFFRITPSVQGAPSNAVPAGVLKIANKWHGIAYKPRGAIGWDPQRNIVLIDILQTQTNLEINGKKLPLHAMNRVANGNKATLLSDSFIDEVNLTASTGILLAHNKVQQVYTQGNFKIPTGAYAYTISGNLQPQLALLKPGDAYTLDFKVEPQLSTGNNKVWDKLPFIIGAGPVLITNKKIISDFKREGLSSDFMDSHYARTAVGVLPNKHWVLVVAESGMLQDKRGLTIQELAQFMASLGCIDAVNLDGGGSSNMYLDARLKSKSTPAEEGSFLAIGRPVSDAILVVEK